MERLADALTGSPVRPRSLSPLLLADLFSEEGVGQRLEEEQHRLERRAAGHPRGHLEWQVPRAYL